MCGTRSCDEAVGYEVIRRRQIDEMVRLARHRVGSAVTYSRDDHGFWNFQSIQMKKYLLT